MSSKDSIIRMPNKHLRLKSQKVNFITPDVTKIIDEMKAATLDWEASRPHEVGVALAAIQIDKPLRVIIVRNNFEDKENKTFSVFINPEIIKSEGEMELDYEGCLSASDVYGKVPRHTKIRLRALDEQGRQVRVKAEGFLARVLQHEIDHTNGLMFTDHLKDNPEAFYRLNKSGKLEKMAYEELSQTGIFRD